jgi:hypothetical protein
VPPRSTAYTCWEACRESVSFPTFGSPGLRQVAHGDAEITALQATQPEPGRITTRSDDGGGGPVVLPAWLATAIPALGGIWITLTKVAVLCP